MPESLKAKNYWDFISSQDGRGIILVEISTSFIQETIGSGGSGIWDDIQEQLESHYHQIDPIILQRIISYAANLIRKEEPPSLELDPKIIEISIIIYELIHQHYILSKQGLHQIYVKFANASFGKCPRTLCGGESLIPLGRSYLYGKEGISMYCPQCQDLYKPQSRKISSLDGSSFGPTMAHFLILNYKSNFPEWENIQTIDSFCPKIFGFKIHSSSPSAALLPEIRSKKPDGYK